MHSILAFFSLLAAPPIAPGACALVPRHEVAGIQKASVVSEKESAMGGKSVESRSCYFETEPFSKSVSLEWTRDREPGAARRQWDSLFHRESAEGDRENEENEQRRAAPRRVEGVGEEAYWVASHASGAIYAWGSGGFVRVSVGGEGTVEERRARAAALARRALGSVAAGRGDAPRR